MSTRRKSSAKVSPLNTPQGVGSSASPSKSSSTSSRKSKLKSVKSSNIGLPTLKLQAAAPQPMTDMTLEELLELKPEALREESAAEKEQATIQRIEEAKEGLRELECEVVSALFPSSGLPEAVEDIAKRLGMTVKEVRDVADDALRGLRGTKSSRPRISTVWN